MRQQAQLEAEHSPDTDRAADPTARMLAFLAAADSPEADRPARERLGYCLGRWVYLIDALADLEQDGRRGRYNPLLLKYPDAPLPEVRAQAAASLNASLAECLEAYRALPEGTFRPILCNILQWGMPAAQQQASLPASERKEGHRI